MLRTCIYEYFDVICHRRRVFLLDKTMCMMAGQDTCLPNHSTRISIAALCTATYTLPQTCNLRGSPRKLYCSVSLCVAPCMHADGLQASYNLISHRLALGLPDFIHPSVCTTIFSSPNWRFKYFPHMCVGFLLGYVLSLQHVS